MKTLTPTAAVVTCNHCHGTGARYDITCADNIATHASATTTCRICLGTGSVVPSTAERPYWLEPGYVPVTTLPVELEWMA